MIVTEHEILDSTEPVLVDFYAEWCGPCKATSGIVAELADEYAGRARVVKVDVDKNPDLAARYGVRSIPAFFFFRDGEVVDQAVGFQSKADLAARLDKVIR